MYKYAVVRFGIRARTLDELNFEWVKSGFIHRVNNKVVYDPIRLTLQKGTFWLTHLAASQLNDFVRDGEAVLAFG